MTINSSVADTKRNLSELINRVAYGDERVVITRRGKPIVAIVSLDDVPAEAKGERTDPVLAILGLCVDHPEVCDAIDEIYNERSLERSRPIPDFGLGSDD